MFPVSSCTNRLDNTLSNALIWIWDSFPFSSLDTNRNNIIVKRGESDMKYLFKNLKPFISYWAAFAIYFVFPFFGIIGLSAFWRVFFLILICVFNLITGYVDGAVKIKWGISLFTFQLALFGILQLLPIGTSNRIIIFGNLINSTVFPNTGSIIVKIIVLIFSIILPVAPFFIGGGIKNLAKKFSKKGHEIN